MITIPENISSAVRSVISRRQRQRVQITYLSQSLLAVAMAFSVLRLKFGGSQPIFQNFNDADEQDVKFKIQLQSAWSNSITLMSDQLDVGFDNPIFSHYFGPNDKEAVRKVFDAMFQGNPNEGSFLLSSVIIDNEDFKGSCVANPNNLCYSQRQFNRGVNNALQVHCCMKERTSKVPELSGAEAITCDALGDSVSYEMFSLSAALLHEYLHFDLIGGYNLPYVVTLPLPQATLILDILQANHNQTGLSTAGPYISAT